MPLDDIALGSVTGFVGGVSSGLLGISPGGVLVVLSVLFLGCDQHVAQGLSLVAQIPPTSLSGIESYQKHGYRNPISWLVLLTIGFVGGGVGGAQIAALSSTPALQWTYVAYLVGLDVLLIVRPASRTETAADNGSTQASGFGLLAVGSVAGFSSGVLGIGGGLAITAGLSAGLKLPQHQAQLISLVISLIPTIIPAAYIYWQHGWLTSWSVLGAAIVGLWLGTSLGAIMTNRLSAVALRRILLITVGAMALYMAHKALA